MSSLFSAAERPVAVEELREGLERGRVREAFGAGTAAVVSPICEIGIDGRDYALPVVGSSGCLGNGGVGSGTVGVGDRAESVGDRAESVGSRAESIGDRVENVGSVAMEL